MFKIMVTGHRPPKLGGYKQNPIKDYVYGELHTAIGKAKATHKNQLVLITGMALGVDQWFAEIAIAKGIPFHAYVPCAGQDSQWPEQSKRNYNALLSEAAEVIMCSNEPYSPKLMHNRNHMMVDNSDCCIAVWDGTPGGTGECVAYALKKNKDIYRIIPGERKVEWMEET